MDNPAQLSPKLEYLTKPHTLAHYCPACNMMHAVYLEGSNFPEKWKWNGNPDQPSFMPSLKHSFTWHYPPNHTPRPEGNDRVAVVCHYHITGGKIQYCHDCTHTYAGMIVDLPDIPPDA